MEAILAAVEASALSRGLKTSLYVYPLVSAAHIGAVGVLLASILIMHARAAGAFARLDLPATELYFRRTALLAFALAALTGLALFSVNATEYALNAAFRIKLVLLALAGINLGAYLALPKWRPVGALASALLWPATLIAGRFIGFV